MTITASLTSRHFPISAGIFFGLGLGGFFDGIVLHQVLQWHHMLSGWYPVNTIENLELNTRWDGIFHSTTYLFVLIGVFLPLADGPPQASLLVVEAPDRDDAARFWNLQHC